MKLYHQTSEQEEATILDHGFKDEVFCFEVDERGRFAVRYGVGFSDAGDGTVLPGFVQFAIDIPEQIAECFEDTPADAAAREFYVPAKLATLYLSRDR